MGIVLYRVDERLIHGQVVIGWGHELRPDRFVLVDDDLAGSEWEQELYRLAAGEADVEFSTVEQARDRLDEWRQASARTILLTRDIAAMRGLAEGGGLAGEEVNLGGLHHAAGRRELLPYLYVSGDDLADLAAIKATGAEVSARDLPDAHRVPYAGLSKG